MKPERAYLYLEHMSELLKHGNIAALRLEEKLVRQCYVDAICEVLPLLERHGVTVEKEVHLE